MADEGESGSRPFLKRSRAGGEPIVSEVLLDTTDRARASPNQSMRSCISPKFWLTSTRGGVALSFLPFVFT
jgi:hypothetical protein